MQPETKTTTPCGKQGGNSAAMRSPSIADWEFEIPREPLTESRVVVDWGKLSRAAGEDGLRIGAIVAEAIAGVSQAARNLLSPPNETAPPEPEQLDPDPEPETGESAGESRLFFARDLDSCKGAIAGPIFIQPALLEGTFTQAFEFLQSRGQRFYSGAHLIKEECPERTFVEAWGASRVTGQIHPGDVVVTLAAIGNGAQPKDFEFAIYDVVGELGWSSDREEVAQ